MRERWLDVDGLRVHACEWRGGTGDERIVLVHGLGASTISWELVGGRLAAALAATVTAVDLAGFGLTRLPPGRRATVRDNRQLLTSLLADHLGPAVVAGNSMGGAIAIAITARRPDLVRALVLVDAAFPRSGRGLPPLAALARFAPMVVPPVGRRVLAARARRLGAERLVDSTLRWTLADTGRLDPGLRDRLVARATERQAFPEAAGAYADAARSLFVAMQRGIAGDLARVACPTLVVHGALDQLVPVAAARAVAAARPDFALHVIDGCGHAPQLERPDEFLAVVVPWLAGLPKQESTAGG